MKNWNDVNTLLNERQDDVDHMETRLMELDLKEKYCKEAIGKLKKSLDSEKTTNVNSGKLREVKDNLKKIMKKVDDLGPNIEAVEALSDDMESRHASSDVSPVKRRAESTRDEYEKLKKAVQEKIDDVNDAVKELEGVETRASSMAEKLEKAARVLDDNKPKKMVVEELLMQAEAVKVCWISVLNYHSNGAQ